MKAYYLMLSLVVAFAAHAKQFTAPDVWQPVNTDAIQKWQAGQKGTEKIRVWNGVVADAQKREVRLLAEAVGHKEGVTAEFLLVGPASDRAYESVAVTVATPGDIARAMEHIGVPRGGGGHSRPFRFWPCGERVQATVRLLSTPPSEKGAPLQSLIKDSGTPPLLGEGGVVFTGGRWQGGGCLADTQQPCSVISLYNEGGSLFDVPFQAAQGATFGRVTLAKTLPYGEVLEITLAPLPAKDGGGWVKQLDVLVAKEGGEVKLKVESSMLKVERSRGSEGTSNIQRPTSNIQQKEGGLAETLAWMKSEDEAGRDLFVTLNMSDDLTLGGAAEVARVFWMLDGKGIKLDGRGEGGVYPKAFLPQERWREREGRLPQPFEIHIAADGKKKLTFIEEDWTVEGLDPKLTPRDYPFSAWDELPELIKKVGGEDSKVEMLFIFAPSGAPLKTFMPAVRALSGRLSLVYIFSE